MEDTLLKQVFNYIKAVDNPDLNQTEFGKALGLTKGYVSVLMRQNSELPTPVREKLKAVYHIDSLWLATNGQEGEIRPTNNRRRSLVLARNKAAHDPNFANFAYFTKLLMLLEEKEAVIAQKDKRIAELTDRLTKK